MKIEVKIERATMNAQTHKSIYYSKINFNSILSLQFSICLNILKVLFAGLNMKYSSHFFSFQTHSKQKSILNVHQIGSNFESLKNRFFFLQMEKKPKQMISTKSLQRPFFHSMTSLVAGKEAFLWEITASNVCLTSTQ